MVHQGFPGGSAPTRPSVGGGGVWLRAGGRHRTLCATGLAWKPRSSASAQPLRPTGPGGWAGARWLRRRPLAGRIISWTPPQERDGTGMGCGEQPLGLLGEQLVQPGKAGGRRAGGLGGGLVEVRFPPPASVQPAAHTFPLPLLVPSWPPSLRERCKRTFSRWQ